MLEMARAPTTVSPTPEVDFSLHTMEDGSQVSTLERVVKGIATIALAVCSLDN